MVTAFQWMPALADRLHLRSWSRKRSRVRRPLGEAPWFVSGFARPDAGRKPRQQERGNAMFDSLTQSIKADEGKLTERERLTHWAVIAFGVAVLLFGGIYVGLYYLQTS